MKKEREREREREKEKKREREPHQQEWLMLLEDINTNRKINGKQLECTVGVAEC